MKVKIMDYETAKAEVLAREQNPYYTNDKTVWGVDKTWLAGDKLETFISVLNISLM